MNKALIRWWTAALNAGNVARLRALAAPDCIVHLGGRPSQDIAAAERFVVSFRVAFPDGPLSIDDLIAEGDRVAHRWTVHGTHQRDFEGIPATGRLVTMTGIFIYRIAGGRVVEIWASVDDLGLLQQLGVVPVPR
jgi:steroid delta-isomerase-like uncharacterized protein